MGIKFPKLDYPAYFEGGLVGARVNANISHREAFLFVPYSVIISTERAHRDPDIGWFFRENKQIFGEEAHDWE